jgi:hypothetical protein
LLCGCYGFFCWGSSLFGRFNLLGWFSCGWIRDNGCAFDLGVGARGRRGLNYGFSGFYLTSFQSG